MGEAKRRKERGCSKPDDDLDDKTWFLQNPNRNFRLRPLKNHDEFDEDVYDLLGPPKPGYRQFVLIKQIIQGVRQRAFLSFEGQPATGEQALSRLFEYWKDNHKDEQGIPYRTHAQWEELERGIKAIASRK